ncbi:MAG: DUF2339 domain-containing protein [Pedobacter sp.]
MESLEQRLSQLECRLERIERHLNLTAQPSATEESFSFHTPQPARNKGADQPTRPASTIRPPASPKSRDTAKVGNAITRLLGWGGAMALVLAAAYLIKLAYESGWLSLPPQARIGLAMVSGLGLIACGLLLRRKDRHYASLLPAAGIVILFLSIYSAHLGYHFIGSGASGAGVVLTCIASLWLCRMFDSDLYALFAIVGSYSAPFLIQGTPQQLWPLMLYFSTWSISFGLFSLFTGRRRYYLLSLYLAVIGFDLIWRHTARHQWLPALGYQTAQLVIFGICAALFTLRHKRPLDQRSAAMHLPALLIFYILQYSLLHRHLPQLAPWLALFSVVAVGLCYLLPRLLLGRELPGGRLILTCYGSLALVHAGYLELVPPGWRPWLALLALPVLAAWLGASRRNISTDWPLLAAIGMLWLVNFGQIIRHDLPAPIYGHKALALLHAMELYAGYALLRKKEGITRLLSGALVYLGHLAAMAAAWQILNSSLGVSMAWGLLALICLGLALTLGDRMLGHSSLLLFIFSALKVLLHDLADAATPVRIGCLLIVGVTFYAGGWLYRYMERMAPPKSS